MKDETKARIGQYLAAFPEVEWDRMTGDERAVTIFGWIARDDGRSDFLVLRLSYPGSERYESCWMTTSSAKFSREFDRRLRGTDEGHLDCIRVADALGEFAP